MSVNMPTALMIIPPIVDEELLKIIVNHAERNLAEAGFDNVVFCGPLKGIYGFGSAALTVYIDQWYSSSRGILTRCGETYLTPPIMLIRGTQPYLSPGTYVKLLWALRSFNRPIVVPARGGKGLSTPILMANVKLFRRLIKLNRRFKLASAMVRFLIENRRDVLMVEVNDECLGVRVAPFACLGVIK
ncbi:MAG: hypothetical protein AT713_07035 [Caldivirga sp. JCHS_4]|nr:MAG: hypothetical protein AT713_07035 [Caldivirga sp. JCHS_4]